MENFNFGSLLILIIVQIVLIMFAEYRGKTKAIFQMTYADKSLFKYLGSFEGIEENYQKYIKPIKFDDLREYATVTYTKTMITIFVTNLPYDDTVRRRKQLIDVTHNMFELMLSEIDDDELSDEERYNIIKDSLDSMNESIHKLSDVIEDKNE